MLNTVLLNLSDLHCNCKRIDQTDVFDAFRRELRMFVKEHSEWKPDFVVLSGDLLENYDEENQAYAMNFLTEIRDICKLSFDEFIAVPGNHDKGYQGFCDLFYEFLRDNYREDLLCLLKNKYKEEREKLKEYLFRFFLKTKDIEKTDFGRLLLLLKENTEKYPDPGTIRNLVKISDDDRFAGKKRSLTKALKELAGKDSKMLDFFLNNIGNGKEQEFYDLQKNSFSGYSGFAKKFSGGMKTMSYLRDESTSCLAGYKVFDDEKIVFLMLNTEWQMMLSQFGESREFKLGRRIVLDLTDEIMKNYPCYTIVTVMHRPPYLLGWGERNEKSVYKLNGYTRLMNVSDVILSGHNHQMKHFYPEYLWNQVQHFQLGSLACSSDKGDDVYPYATSLLKINSFRKEIELVCGVIDTDSSDYRWSMRFDLPESKVYPMKGVKDLPVAGGQIPVRAGAVEILDIKRNRHDADQWESLQREVLRVIMNRFYRDWNIRYDEWVYDCGIDHGRLRYNCVEWKYSQGGWHFGLEGWEYRGTVSGGMEKPPKIMSLDCFCKEMMGYLGDIPLNEYVDDYVASLLQNRKGDEAGFEFFTGGVKGEPCHLIVYSLDEGCLGSLLKIRGVMMQTNRLIDTIFTTVMLLN